MGGNALKTVTRRYERTEYFSLQQRVLNEFSFLLPTTEVATIPSYYQKETFGDMDLVMETDNLPTNWKDQLKNHFLLRESDYYDNKTVFSFAFRQCQVDLILKKSEDIQIAVDYFSYSDLSNLLGRIFHKLGVKYGSDGLSIIFKTDSNHVLDEVCLTKNLKEILPIIGLSYRKFRNGFNSLEDIFEYVVSSPFFNSDIYLLENRNTISRTRDKKRKTYHDFLEWIKSQKESGRVFQKYPFSDLTERGGHNIREPFFSDIFCQKYSFLKSHYEYINQQFEIDQNFKQVFNGEIVSNITGLTGKQLGSFIAEFKKQVLNEPIDVSLKIFYTNHPNILTKKIEEFHEIFLNTGNGEI